MVESLAVFFSDRAAIVAIGHELTHHPLGVRNNGPSDDHRQQGLFFRELVKCRTVQVKRFDQQDRTRSPAITTRSMIAKARFPTDRHAVIYSNIARAGGTAHIGRAGAKSIALHTIRRCRADRHEATPAPKTGTP